MCLALWVRRSYLDHDYVARLHARYIRAEPFHHIVLRDLIIPSRYTQLRRALSKQRFARKEADLFSFSQTADLLLTEDPIIKEFVALLRSSEFNDFVRRITGVRLRRGAVDASGHRYARCDHLLCHDDRMDGRRIAYVLHFSTLDRADGGAFALFAHDLVGRPTRMLRRVAPCENSLVLFTVSRTSHHQVDEVLSGKNRLTIAGWFHG